MLKIYVVVVGLTLVVPDTDNPPKGVTAILVDAEGQKDVYGDRMPPHRVTLNRRDNGKPIDLTPGFHVALTKSCANGTCTVSMEGAEAHQPDLRMLSDRSGNSVRPECLDPASRGDCLGARDRSLVKGHLRLEGNWTATAGTACSEGLPSRSVENVDWTYQRRTALFHNWKRRDGPPARVGNAYIFEADVAAGGNDLSLRINGIPSNVEFQKSAACDDLGASGKACAIYEFRNVTHSHITINLEDPHATNHRQDPVDKHFAVLYQLFGSKPKYKWVPMASSLFCGPPSDHVGSVEVPGNRCGGGGG